MKQNGIMLKLVQTPISPEQVEDQIGEKFRCYAENSRT